ncbi:RNA-binding protein 41-like [Panulirus ornatus]|uniref:RNA-binding protein 41-like n=1 Tax=Panulirus ornatus TaxID=150431 RepID=UPI003A8805A9
MASITDNNAKKYRFLGLEEERLEKPRTDTLREKVIKDLIQRQLTTHTSLEQQHQNQREFISATAEESITTVTSGLASYEDYKSLELSLNVKEILRYSGLSDNEIQLLMSEDNGDSSLEAPQAREQKLKAIENKLLKRQNQLETLTEKPEHFNGAIPLNRHDFEEECSVIPSSAEAEKLTPCLVRLQPHQDETIPDDHPINHIKHMAEELFPSDEVERSQDAKPRKHKIEDDFPDGPLEKNKKESPSFVYLSEKPKSFWDMKEIPKISRINKSNAENLCIATNTPKNKCSGKKSNTFKAENKDKKHNITDFSKQFVLTLDHGALIPLETIKSNRKSIEELRTIEKFKNYDTGKPSSTLYIKNLPHKVSPHDLASLMGHFESTCGPKIMYRILCGRMKGQAFVTFQDKEMATNALNMCNGYILHEKPLVIEFGKKC